MFQMSLVFFTESVTAGQALFGLQAISLQLSQILGEFFSQKWQIFNQRAMLTALKLYTYVQNKMH